ncbi:MAG: right-handed parallel beta-helix repeat-containing protein [Planctomycetaceae bacterium]
MSKRFSLVLCGAVVALSLRIAGAAEFHVSPDGSHQGQGTAAEPWDLATALAAPEIVRPGDTIWLHGGTYRGGFVSRLTGRRDEPVVVRGIPQERATIDTRPRDDKDSGALLLYGADVVYRDFEVTCSDPLRETNIAGSWPEDIRRGHIDVRGDRLLLVNLVVHDCGSGFGFWSEGEGGEISGCLIYNNGWRGPDRGHGHGIYAQNAKGTKRIADNVVFHQFGYGVHLYGSKKASLKGIEIDGNIAFENGCLTRKGDNAPGIIAGGESPLENLAVRDNIVVGGRIRIGYPWGETNHDVVCTGNYCDQGLIVRDFREATVMRNTVVSDSGVVALEGAGKLLLEKIRWNENDYFVTDGRYGECTVLENSKSRGLSFDEWRKVTGFDSKSQFTKGLPTQPRIVVRPNRFERGRANIAILNPAGQPDVEVDLSEVLSPGQSFRIVSVKDFYGPSIIAGVFDGQSLKIPMRPIATPAPVGMPECELPVTEPHFAAFVVLPE